jgi:hypothetical protein
MRRGDIERRVVTASYATTATENEGALLYRSPFPATQIITELNPIPTIRNAVVTEHDRLQNSTTTFNDSD